MELFELKRIDKLTWDDIPFINTPSFASYYTFSAMNFPSDIWRRIINIREFISAEFGVYNPLSHYRYAEDRVRWLIQSGQHFCISRRGKPFDPAFIWNEDPNHPHQGEWTDPQRNYWMNPTITDELARIGHRWHKLKTQAFMDELLDSPYAIAREAEKKVMAAPKAVKAAAEKPLSVSTKISEPTNSIAPIEPAYKILKGKYGTLHDYGDYIVHWDIDNAIDRTDITSYPDYKMRHCYALGEGYGLPITDNITPGKPLLNFGGEIPHGTIFATFVPDNRGNLVYPNSRNGINKSPHLFVYDANGRGLTEENGKKTISVIEQWAGLQKVSAHEIQNNNLDNHRLYKHLDKYYAVKIKK